MTIWAPDVRHSVYATRVLRDVANERGVSTRDVLAGTGIEPDDLQRRPFARRRTQVFHRAGHRRHHRDHNGIRVARGGKVRRSGRGITAVVRSKLFRDSGIPVRIPRLPDVAAELDLHPRTLRRQLAAEGTSFRALLGEARSNVAVDLLCHVGLTVEQVSRRLGYTDTSTFTHAFKRWHGVAPSEYSRDRG